MDKKTLVTGLVGLVLFVVCLALMNRIENPPETKEQELERLIRSIMTDSFTKSIHGEMRLVVMMLTKWYWREGQMEFMFASRKFWG